MVQNVEELMLLDWLQFKRDGGQIKQNTEVFCIAVVKILRGFHSWHMQVARFSECKS